MLAAAGCAKPQAAMEERQEYIFGVPVTVKLYAPVEEAAFTAVFSALREIDNTMSTRIPASEISQINAQAGIAPVRVSDDTWKVITRGLKYGALSEGGFDPTVEPLVLLWGIGTDAAKVPDRGALQEALGRVDYRKVVLDAAAQTVYLPEAGMGLDLGAIAKGFAADKAVEVLRKEGVSAGIINVGGNVFAYGRKEDGQPWQVAVQDPFSQRGEYLGVVSAADRTVVTSGIYERYFEEGGVRYHHILDTQTGYPVDNTLAGVSILTDSSIDADALSTTCFVLGLEAGMRFAEAQGAEALFVTKDKEIYMTPGFEAVFKLTNSAYVLKGEAP